MSIGVETGCAAAAAANWASWLERAAVKRPGMPAAVVAIAAVKSASETVYA